MSSLIKKSSNKIRPIWLMRQAGRYLPEYQKIRKTQKNFINFCLNINAATEVTLQPIRRYNFDAAIIFSDILVIPYALGQDVRFEENIGPILGDFNLENFKKIKAKQFKKKIKNIYLAIKKTRKKLSKEKTLIGFAGSPWTILVYIINKQSPKKKQVYKKILKNKRQTKQLLTIIEKFIFIHIKEQIKAGADTIQLFDSWAGLLRERDLNNFCFQPTKRIVKNIKRIYPGIPITCFPKGIGKNISKFCKIVKPDVLNIDSKISPDFVNKKINKNIVIQGGLDPKFLLLRKETLKKKAHFYLKKFIKRNYIFNLGHGVAKETKPEAVQRLVNIVRTFK